VDRRHATVAIVVGLLVIAVPLTISSVRIGTTQSAEDDVTTIADTWAATTNWQIASVTTTARPQHRGDPHGRVTIWPSTGGRS
jgi:hypothetical protein